mgnify:CR=1 FL=1
MLQLKWEDVQNDLTANAEYSVYDLRNVRNSVEFSKEHAARNRWVQEKVDSYLNAITKRANECLQRLLKRQLEPWMIRVRP